MGSSMKRQNCAVNVNAIINPIAIPSISALITVENVSYSSIFQHYVLFIPIAFKTPNSQKLSLMFAFVDVSNKKKAKMRAMIPTMIEKSVNSSIELYKEALSYRMSNAKLISSLRKDLTPFVMNCLLQLGRSGFSLMKRKSLGTLFLNVQDLIVS